MLFVDLKVPNKYLKKYCIKMSDQKFFFIAKSINYRIFTNTPANDFFENHEILKIVIFEWFKVPEFYFKLSDDF